MTTITLIAGPVRWDDWIGHHDYLGGCRLVAACLQSLPGVDANIVENGWPDDTAVLQRADSVVFYDGGNGKQQFLKHDSRRQTVQALADRGVGLCFFHQAAVFPEPYRTLGEQCLGGVYLPHASSRGHWRCRQERFPAHPVFHGVTPWSLRDGWLNGFRFIPESERITALVHSARRRAHSRGASGRVSWLYDRPDGGSSFVFTGLDSHRAWHRFGLRRFIANAVLWTAGVDAPANDAFCALDRRTINGFRTKRAAPTVYLKNKGRKLLQGRRKAW